MNKDPEINELSIFLNELHEESDRGIALLSASIFGVIQRESIFPKMKRNRL
ncbi:TPA: hypothetical protein SMN57_001582 [Proteus mirabilis]|nr:hypothetical protein [Proteus mirabilis]